MHINTTLRNPRFDLRKDFWRNLKLLCLPIHTRFCNLGGPASGCCESYTPTGAQRWTVHGVPPPVAGRRATFPPPSRVPRPQAKTRNLWPLLKGKCIYNYGAVPAPTSCWHGGDGESSAAVSFRDRSRRQSSVGHLPEILRHLVGSPQGVDPTRCRRPWQGRA